MTHIWTIEIGGVEKKYREINFDRSLSLTPTEFTAKIEYEADLPHFSTVEILNNGVIEWYGYVETVVETWDEEGGRYLDIWGRDRLVLLWKKWTERYSDSRTEGFFGAVNPTKLINFLLRCPISDPVVLNYTDQSTCESNNGVWDNGVCYSGFHKTGWGIDSRNWNCYAISTTEGRSPNYVKSRISGFSWSKGAIEDDDNVLTEDSFVDSISEWIDEGSGDLGDSSYSTGIKTVAESSHSHAIENSSGATVTLDDVTKFNVQEEILIFHHDNYIPYIYALEWAIIGSINLEESTVTFTRNLEYFVYTDTTFYKRYTYIQSYYTITDSSISGSSVVSSAILNVYGKYIKGTVYGVEFGARKNADVDVYIDVTGSFVKAGTLIWYYGEEGYNSAANIVKSLDISPYIDTITKLNALKIKFVVTVDQSYDVMISKIIVQYTAELNQKENDWFKIDLGSIYDRVCGIYIECRSNNNAYARNYTISLSPDDFTYVEKIDVSNNICRDIIESWMPTDGVRYIKIIIDSAVDYGWEISQVYVYCADDKKYCIWNTGTGSVLGPYLDAEEYYSDDYPSTLDENNDPLGPITSLNIPFSRMNDVIADIIKKSYGLPDELKNNYASWEFWVTHETGYCYFKPRKGSDKSALISFVKGSHIGKTIKSSDSRNISNRVKIVGKSESKIQDEITSSWKSNVTSESNVGTFYENIISSKRISSKDTSNILADIEATNNGETEKRYEIPITNDIYTSMAYDVGDDVTITDSLTGMSGSYRIHTISKSIKKGVGEDIKLIVNTNYEDISNDMAETRKRIRELGLGASMIEDWLADGAMQNKIDINKVTDTWDKTAKNEEQFAPKTAEDDAWVIDNGSVTGQDLICFDQWFVLKGSKVYDSETKTLIAYILNSDNVLPNIRWDASPRFVCDFKIPNANSGTGDATTWHENDICYITMAGIDLENWFGYWIIYENSIYKLYYGFGIVDEGNQFRAIKDINNTPIIILEKVKYRLECKLEWENRVMKFYFNNKLIAILSVPQSKSNLVVFPLYLALYTINDNPVASWSQLYIYKYKSEWEWVEE